MSVNTFSPELLLPSLRLYLIAQGLVRDPDVAGAAPPLWLDPKRGIPYPGQTEDLTASQTSRDIVLAAYPATGIAPRPFEGFVVEQSVALWYRTRKSPQALALHEQIRGAINDRRNYDLGGLQVNESILLREIQRISADERGYVYNCEYKFTLWGPAPGDLP